MRVGETIQGRDLAEALRGERGKFHVTSPNSKPFIVTCKPGHSIANLEYEGSSEQLFTIRKIAEPVAMPATAGDVGNGGWAD